MNVVKVAMEYKVDKEEKFKNNEEIKAVILVIHQGEGLALKFKHANFA